ncbi:hypothetical protein BKA82DRAFT_4364871 [Pisolithus tinctorius]|nr:hypothetical protein BKA82DRAFT_4364871 [Pisolithus tinctorius]
MPPKKSAQGRSRKDGQEGVGKKMMLGESLLVGGGGRSQKATLDDKAQAHQELEKGVKRAIVGIARFDLIENMDRLTFGIWNSRQVVQTQVTNLTNSFLQNGLDRFNAAHTIPLVIDKRWIKKDSYTTGNPMDLDIEQIPLLEIDETLATKNWNIPAAGGQHRTRALKAWHEKKKMRLHELELLINRLKKQDMEEATEADIVELNDYLKEVDVVKGLLGYGGQWLVTIYSKGDIDEKLGLFISQNERKHTYVEAPAEGLIQRFKEALVLGHKWYDIPRAGVNAGPVGKQTELLSQDYAFKLMSFMNSASTHYIHSPIFDLNKLHAMMMSPGGGIIAYVMSALEEKLALCFNTVEFTMAEFKDLNKKASKRDASVEKDQARDRLRSILDTLKRASPLCQAIVPKVRDVIDAVFAGHLVADSETSGHLCQALFARPRNPLPSKIGEDLRAPCISAALPPKDAHFANSSDVWPPPCQSSCSSPLLGTMATYIYQEFLPASILKHPGTSRPRLHPPKPIQLGQCALFVSTNEGMSFLVYKVVTEVEKNGAENL